MFGIRSINGQGHTCVLVDSSNGKIVEVGSDRSSSRGDVYSITGGRAPHKPGSTGRVYTEPAGEFFPSVFGLEWRPVGVTAPISISVEQALVHAMESYDVPTKDRDQCLDKLTRVLEAYC